MKIGDVVYFRENIKEYTLISDIVGDIIWVLDYNVKVTNLFTPYTKSDFMKCFITEKEMRKQKLNEINESR